MIRILKASAGFLLLALGVAMIITPGPGWLAIGGGLALLATEYEWARRWLQRIRDHSPSLAHRFRGLKS
jgi:uncharacterized protein (TIGR02611 family)